jgi:hypothetical protein
LQRRNFYGAFVQARALDLREQNLGMETLQVGRIAMQNESWDDAIMIFEYLVKTYGGSPRTTFYEKMLIEARDHKVRNTYPVDREAIKSLCNDYKKLYIKEPQRSASLEALRNMAHLHAFYLNEKDTAAIVLRTLIDSRRTSSSLKAKAKLELGDIYLLKDEAWEATLLYSQVEKSHKESPIGYEAKLKNARLHFYQGNFKLAKSHLDILKNATTRQISNDAIDLSVLISDNTYMDSTDEVMQKYAAIDLLIFQNQHQEAKQALLEMKEKYVTHSIYDEVCWKLSDLAQKEGAFDQAVDYLNTILEEVSYDILADDAAFRIAEITDRYFKDEDKAKSLYENFLVEYPGSMYAAQARKRFRELRGDFLPKS